MRRITHGLAALQDIAKDMDGNLESMPSPAIKAFHLAYNTKRASNKFLAKLSGSRVFPGTDDDVQSADMTDAQRKLSRICTHLLQNPKILEALEKEHGGAKEGTTGFADFAAAYALEYAEANDEIVGEDAA